MSDRDQPAPGEPSFDDPAFDDLRALLAETRVVEPVPTPVAARLDASLDSLRDQRAASRGGASVVVLRRRVARALVAAAAVAVIGAGSVGILRGGSDAGNDRATSSADAGSADKAAEPQDRDDALPGESAAEGNAGAAAVPSLTSAHFARDAAVTMRALSVTETAATPAAPSPVPTPSGSTSSDALSDLATKQAPPVTATPRLLRGTLDTPAATDCAGPHAPDAVVLYATLDGVPVALVFRPPTASAQQVEAWSCNGASLLASASVPR